MADSRENAVRECAANPLQETGVFVHLHEVLAVVRVRHVFRNIETNPVEAVFTFPVPLDGIFLDVDVEIAGRHLPGKAVEKKQAEDRYEEAVAEGDAAVLLQELEPGLFALNLGSLKKGEDAAVTYRYAEVLRWQSGQARFCLPTAVAPRYGSSRHEMFHVPDVDLLACNEFSLEVRITGGLANAGVCCPTHEVRMIRSRKDVRIVPESARLPMDRDFVLELRPECVKSFGVCARHEDGFISLAAFVPSFSDEKREPMDIKIVCDCSGSMGGDSIREARHAINLLLDSLEPEDRFTILRFGSMHTLLYSRLQSADSRHLEEARRYVRGMRADLGGTEMASALRAAFAVPTDGHCHVILITDGEIWDQHGVVRLAHDSGHRLFTIGVGSAANEALVQRLARETGGACELVTPRENMREAVRRHLRRIRSHRARKGHVTWPMPTDWEWPATEQQVYEGDTFLAFAASKAPPFGVALLACDQGDGEQTLSDCRIPDLEADTPGGLDGETLARIAAAYRLRGMAAADGLSLALKYNLLSEHTHYLVVHERSGEEKAEGFPVLRKVPHMLAAGWGGVGSELHEDLTLSASLAHPRSYDEYPADPSICYDEISLSFEEDMQIEGHPLASISLFRGGRDLSDKAYKKASRSRATRRDMKNPNMTCLRSEPARTTPGESAPIPASPVSHDEESAEKKRLKRKARAAALVRALKSFISEFNLRCARDIAYPEDLKTIKSLEELGLPEAMASELHKWCEDEEDQWEELEVIIAFFRWLAFGRYGRKLGPAARRAIRSLPRRYAYLDFESLEDEYSGFHEDLEHVMSGKERWEA